MTKIIIFIFIFLKEKENSQRANPEASKKARFRYQATKSTRDERETVLCLVMMKIIEEVAVMADSS